LAQRGVTRLRAAHQVGPGVGPGPVDARRIADVEAGRVELDLVLEREPPPDALRAGGIPRRDARQPGAAVGHVRAGLSDAPLTQERRVERIDQYRVTRP